MPRRTRSERTPGSDATPKKDPDEGGFPAIAAQAWAQGVVSSTRACLTNLPSIGYERINAFFDAHGAEAVVWAWSEHDLR